MAFNARDMDHEEDLWLGDLRAGPIGIAYVAPKATGKKADIWWPQLGGGQLLWIEYVHTGPNVNTDVSAWSVKRMDVSTRVVSTVAQDRALDFGGKKYVSKIRWGGKTLAMGESLPNLTWQIELWDLSGNVEATVPVSGDLYDLALTNDGVIYTTGTPFPANDSIGLMKTYRWTSGSGSVQIGTGAFEVAAADDLAAWISDPVSSRDSTGYPVSARAYAARAPFTVSEPLSPSPSTDGTSGVEAVAAGSGTVLWLEVEGRLGTGRDVLTAWQPGWSAPVQLQTDGDPADLSVRNGWVVWFEIDADQNVRLRGTPLSVLPNWRG